jgi:hypothetical protein
MVGRRAIVGFCMLCALLVSAFAAQSASAVIKGTTAFTCKEEPTAIWQFKDEHCKEESSGGNTGKFRHVEIKQDTTTHITLSNKKTTDDTKESTPQRLKATINGIATELVATEVHGTGGLTNKLDAATGDHYIHTKNVKLVYTGVEVAKPAGKGCKVYTDETKPGEEMTGKEQVGVVDTEPLTGTSLGQGDSLKFTPTEGTVFARFWITGCEGSEALKALNKTYTVEGSATGKPTGATITFSHEEITAAGTLKLNGAVKSGYEGRVTVTGSHNEIEEPTRPISVTTVNT